MSTPIRTLLVEDHPSLSEAMKTLLGRDASVTVVGEACRGEDALVEVPRRHPDVVVVDLKLSDRAQRDGLHLINDLTRRFPAVATVALTTVPDDDLVIRAVMAGARGHAIKNSDTFELARAIHGAYLEHHDVDRDHRPVSITEQDRALLRFIAQGMSNQRLASALDLPESTVRSRVRRVLCKLDVSTRAEAVYIATKMDLI